MALIKEFDRKLTELWHRRIVNIESLVKQRVGRPKAFTVEQRDNGIRYLQEVAESILTKQGAQEALGEITDYTSRHHLRGRGWEARSENMLDWASQCTGPIVYSFWHGATCLYVGKGKRWTRLNGYSKSFYLREATVVKIRGIVGKSQLGRAECLAKHLYRPRDNRNEPAKGKWSKACDVCRATKMIKTELRYLFRLR